MTFSSVLKTTFFLTLVMIFSGSQYKVSGQISEYLDFIETDFKWQKIQKWDKSTQSWNDTVLLYTVSGATGKSSEMIYRIKDQNGSFQTYLREVFTYEGDKIKTSTSCFFDTVTNDFEQRAYSSTTFWFSGDMLEKIESTSRPFVFLGELSSDFAAMDKIVLHEETVYTIEGQRVIACSTSSRYSGITAEEAENLSFILGSLDTAWTLQSRTEYTYVGNAVLALNYSRDNDSSDLILTGKDSTIMVGDKFSEVYAFTLNTNQEWMIDDFTKCNYNGDSITEVISQSVENGALVNNTRLLFFYTPYSGSNVKHLTDSHYMHSIGARISENHGCNKVNITLNRSSDVSIYITDLKGRKTGNMIKSRLSSGTHSIPLTVSSPGKYICNIITGKNRTVIPFAISK